MRDERDEKVSSEIKVEGKKASISLMYLKEDEVSWKEAGGLSGFLNSTANQAGEGLRKRHYVDWSRIDGIDP